MMNEDQKNWNEMAKIMMKINRKPEEMFNTVHIKHQFYGEVSRTFVDVLSTMYSFTKGARFTHLNLEGIMECKIVYNHWRIFAKIGYGWRTFVKSQNLELGMQIIFEFLDVTSNFVLF
ncbi:hypothetical protein HKD37_06G016046 [Glycine soja]